MILVLYAHKGDGFLHSIRKFAAERDISARFYHLGVALQDPAAFTQDGEKLISEGGLFINRLGHRERQVLSWGLSKEARALYAAILQIPGSHVVTELQPFSVAETLWEQWEFFAELGFQAKTPDYYYGLPASSSPFAPDDPNIIRSNEPRDLHYFKPGPRRNTFFNRATFEFRRPDGFPVSVLLAGGKFSWKALTHDVPKPETLATVEKIAIKLSRSLGSDCMESLWFIGSEPPTFAMMSPYVESWSETAEIDAVLSTSLDYQRRTT